MTASAIAEPIARTAPSSPTRNRVLLAVAAAPGAPAAISSGTSGGGGEHEGLGRDRRTCARARAASSAVASGGRWRAGSSSGARDRPADPEARDRGVAPGVVRVVGEHAGRAGLGEVRRDLGIVGGRLAVRAMSASAGSASSPNGIARPRTVTGSPGASRASW